MSLDKKDSVKFILTKDKLNLSVNNASSGDGNETIKWVGFTSFSLRDNAMMNNGNMIYLYDDGGTEILYPPDFTSGDSVRDDGIYTLKFRYTEMDLVLKKMMIPPELDLFVGDFHLKISQMITVKR